MSPEKITAEVQRLAGRGLYAAGLFYSGRLGEVLSVPAPRRLVTAGPRSRAVPPGTQYYVATTPATPGAPPRKLSGRLRASRDVRKLSDAWVQVGMGGVKYARRLEFEQNHAYLVPTLRRYMPEMTAILRGAALDGRVL